jgi:hypothetical protein
MADFQIGCDGLFVNLAMTAINLNAALYQHRLPGAAPTDLMTAH